MDNNNNLPYGAIGEDNESLFTQRRARIPPGNNQEQQLPQFFSPIDMARNVNLDASGQRQDGYIRPWPSSGGAGGSTAPLGIHGGQPVMSLAPYIGAQPGQTNGPSNSYINNQNPDRRSVGQISQNSITGLFRPPWSAQGRENGRTVIDNSVTNTAVMADMTGPMNLDITARNHAEPGKSPTGRVKRKVIRNGSEQDEPSSKQLITEERMAAKMHNLHISSDHAYSSNGLLPGWHHVAMNNNNNNTESQQNREQEKQDDDSDESMSDAHPNFTFAPGMKDFMGKKTSLLPQAILDHINKPCLAIIPWKPPDDLTPRINFHSMENRTDDDKAKENENYKNEELLINQSGLGTGVDHVEVIGDMNDTFDFDDMDL